MPPDGHSYRHDLRHPRPAGRGGIVFRCPEPPGGPACFFPSNALTGPEIQVTVRKPQALLLSLAVALALSACQIGRAHVGTPVTTAHLVYRLLLVKKTTT